VQIFSNYYGKPIIYHEEISIYAITSSKGRLQKEEKSPPRI